MIEIRKLELDEWPEDAALRSDQAICIAAIKGEKVVGRIFLTSIIHLEGIEIDEAERNSTLMGRLVEEAEKEARAIRRLSWLEVQHAAANMVERAGEVAESMRVCRG